MCEKIYFPEAESLGQIITIIQMEDSDEPTAERIMYDSVLTLNDIDVSGKGVTIVISEDALKGSVYRYGNHGPFWEKVGKTCGYA